MDATNVFVTQGTSILLIPMLVQWLKRSNLPGLGWITADSERVNRSVAWALGAAAAIGIHAAADFSGGVLSLSIDFTHVTVSSVMHEVMAVAGQLGGQQFVFTHLKTLELLRQVLEEAAKKDAGAAV